MGQTVEGVRLVGLNVFVEAVTRHAKLEHITTGHFGKNADAFAKIKSCLLATNTKKRDAVLKMPCVP